jgi:hypothetical protein
MVAGGIVVVVDIAVVDGTLGNVVVVPMTVLVVVLLKAARREFSLGDVNADTNALATVRAIKAPRTAQTLHRSVGTVLGYACASRATGIHTSRADANYSNASSALCNVWACSNFTIPGPSRASGCCHKLLQRGELGQ